MVRCTVDTESRAERLTPKNGEGVFWHLADLTVLVINMISLERVCQWGALNSATATCRGIELDDE